MNADVAQMNDSEQLIQLGGWKLRPKDIEIVLRTLLTVPKLARG